MSLELQGRNEAPALTTIHDQPFPIPNYCIHSTTKLQQPKQFVMKVGHMSFAVLKMVTAGPSTLVFGPLTQHLRDQQFHKNE